MFTKQQAVQSVLQFLVVFVTGMLIYENIPVGADGGFDVNALWQPTLQGVLAALLILGGSKIGPKVPPPG